MHNFAAFFLYAFVACNIYGLVKSESEDDTGFVYIPKDSPSRELQPLQNSIQFLQKQLKLQITTQKTTLAILDTMQKNTQEKLEAIQREVLKSLEQMKNETNERLDRIEDMLERRPLVTEAPRTNTIPKGFEKIGSRYFYIEEEIKKNWIDAQFNCREKGGYLAAIQDPEEFEALISKLSKDNRYWLGINDRDYEGAYVSVASGNAAPFLKWISGDPDNRDNYENCVGVAYGSGMADWPCRFAFNFICSLDNTV
ncbi:accessory gland protein Acp29AB-like [Drosophila takahashii]|uniref:accessory gland protein Acp29AB-like n=1 Tax=Drosophila takahashii TaxID=29030 RepID=UPI001CF8F335|nr:accessory gland protein Acp29AB-like [Drosophila takahashii]